MGDLREVAVLHGDLGPTGGQFRVSWMNDSGAPGTSSPTNSRKSRWRAMIDTTGVARRASPPSTKFVILLAGSQAERG